MREHTGPELGMEFQLPATVVPGCNTGPPRIGAMDSRKWPRMMTYDNDDHHRQPLCPSSEAIEITRCHCGNDKESIHTASTVETMEKTSTEYPHILLE